MNKIINGCFGEPCKVPDSARPDQGGFVRAMEQYQKKMELNAHYGMRALSMSGPHLGPRGKCCNKEFVMSGLKPFFMACMALKDAHLTPYQNRDPDNYPSMDLPEV